MTLLLVSVGSRADAQQETRSALLQRATTAYDDFDLARAARLARQAVDPALGPRDSAWTRGVHLLTQLLLESDRPAHAQLWARWALRLEPTMPLDSANFLARVVGTLRAARDSAARSASDAAVRESYVWPSATSTATDARFRLGQSTAPVRVLVRGVGVLSAGAGVTVEPGRYEIEVTADGFLPLRITREALPGVTTELSFLPLSAAAAAASLEPQARQRVEQGLVTLNVQRFGLPTRCAIGVLLDAQGRIAVSYESIRGADSLWIGGSTVAVGVAAWDRSANLAILSAGSSSATPLDAAPAPMAGQALFGLGRRDCDTFVEGRALVHEGPASAVSLTAPATGIEVAAPMVDFEGRFVGFYEGGVRVQTLDALAALNTTADANIAAGVLRRAREVAEAERQRFGVVVLSSAARGARIRVEPMEPWHWAALDTTAASPFTFAGPAGRYRVHLLATRAAAQSEVVTVAAGTRSRSTLSGRTAIASTGSAPTAQRERRRVPKWVWYTAAGVGVVAGIALSGSGGGDPPPAVIISVPNP
ncbi:MAG: hypothetical protein C0503_00060 [Gemmatimonas sp.]|nr:hypothetical protein [Gemmatimonas sp.]